MRRRVTLVVIALVAVAGCGDGETSTDTVLPATESVTVAPTPQPGTIESTAATSPATVPATPAPVTEPTPPPTTAARPQVGAVLEVVSPGGDVDGQTAEGGGPILRAGIVTTEAAGKIHFEVQDKIEQCILRGQGQAIVVPGDGPLVRLERGAATCRTRPGGEAVTIEAGGVQIVVADPVFRLVVDEGGLASIGVAQGAVRVGDEIIVGGQQAPYTAGIGVGGREVVEFDEDLANLGQALPPVVFDAPASGSSATVDAARDRGVLVVRVVEGTAPSGDLAAALLGPFGNVLGVQVDVAGTDEAPAVAAESLGNEVDVMVTDQPVDGLPTELLFELAGTSWFAQAQPGDDGFTAAARAYLAGILQAPCPDGPGRVEVVAGDQVCYVDRYELAFGRGATRPAVPLDRFGSLLGL